jgi:multiple antibiotic resistance protein
MPELPFLILILLAGLGPMRAAPAFAAMTADATPKERLKLACLAVAVATVIVLVLAFAGEELRKTWDIPWAAASVAAGLVLIMCALHGVASAWAPAQPKPEKLDLTLAFSPLAAPLLLTPYGVAIILLLLPTADQFGGRFRLIEILALVAVMGFNLACLLAAPRIVRGVGLPAFRVAGWTLAVMLAAVGVQTLVGPLSNFFYHAPPGDDQGYDDEATGYSRLTWTHHRHGLRQAQTTRDAPPPILCRGDRRCAL